jgi:hypothetical protein
MFRTGVIKGLNRDFDLQNNQNAQKGASTFYKLFLSF